MVHGRHRCPLPPYRPAPPHRTPESTRFSARRGLGPQTLSLCYGCRHPGSRCSSPRRRGRVASSGAAPSNFLSLRVKKPGPLCCHSLFLVQRMAPLAPLPLPTFLTLIYHLRRRVLILSLPVPPHCRPYALPSATDYVLPASLSAMYFQSMRSTNSLTENIALPIRPVRYCSSLFGTAPIGLMIVGYAHHCGTRSNTPWHCHCLNLIWLLT